MQTPNNLSMLGTPSTACVGPSPRPPVLFRVRGTLSDSAGSYLYLSLYSASVRFREHLRERSRCPAPLVKASTSCCGALPLYRRCPEWPAESALDPRISPSADQVLTHPVVNLANDVGVCAADPSPFPHPSLLCTEPFSCRPSLPPVHQAFLQSTEPSSSPPRPPQSAEPPSS